MRSSSYLKIGLTALVLGLASINCGGSSGGGSSGGNNKKPVNYAPTVTITSPSNNSSYLRGSQLNFNASCSLEDPITASGWDPVTGLLPSGLDTLVDSVSVPLTSTLGNKVLTAYCTDYNAKKDPASTTGEKSVTIEVLNNPPVANAGIDQSAPSGSDITLPYPPAIPGSDIDGNIVLYEWDINGDGLYDWSSTKTGSILVGYPDGNYTATLRVTDNDGGIDTDTVNICVGAGC